MKKVQKQLLFLPVLCLSMAIGGCGKKETDKDVYKRQPRESSDGL